MSKIIEKEQTQCPPHEYQAVKYQVQEAVTTRHDYRDKLVTVLCHEKIKLFCIKCGDVKEVDGEKTN